MCSEASVPLIMSSPLPQTDSHVELTLLAGGSFTATANFLHAGAAATPFTMFNWAFHISHPSGRQIVWDVGNTSNPDDYTPWVRQHMFPLGPFAPPEPIEQQIKRRTGVPPEGVDTVIFSHAHWDHCRPIRALFPRATGYFGPGTAEFCGAGHFSATGEELADVPWDGNFFHPEHRTESWEALRGPWKRFGPFERAMDFLGDGTMWVIQAPGHMGGNLACAVRIEGGEWVLLASDCCHSRGLLEGKYDIATWCNPDGSQGALHVDIPAAKDTMAKLRVLRGMGVHLALAHDVSWVEEGTDPVLMGLLDQDLKEWVEEGLKTGRLP